MTHPKDPLQYWASLLNGRHYPLRLTPDEKQQLKDDGIVVVFGASDDLCEFDGAVYDEVGAWTKAAAYINSKGDVSNDPLGGVCKRIDIEWCEKEDITWSYRTDIPHKKFYIMEENEINCQAILFYLKDCGPKPYFELNRVGNGWEVWDASDPLCKFPMVRVDTKGAYDDIHVPLAELIRDILNYQKAKGIQTLGELRRELGLD